MAANGLGVDPDVGLGKRLPAVPWCFATFTVVCPTPVLSCPTFGVGGVCVGWAGLPVGECGCSGCGGGVVVRECVDWVRECGEALSHVGWGAGGGVWEVGVGRGSWGVRLAGDVAFGRVVLPGL